MQTQAEVQTDLSSFVSIHYPLVELVCFDQRLVEKLFAVLFVILATVNRLFSDGHLIENICKHIA